MQASKPAVAIQIPTTVSSSRNDVLASEPPYVLLLNRPRSIERTQSLLDCFLTRMAAGSSSSAGLVAVVDDFYISVLAHGRNDDGHAGDDELFPISDEKYAAELQLQEVIMSSSAVATTAESSAAASPRLCITAAAAAAPAASVHGKGECSYASSSSSHPSPPLAVASAAATLVFCKICMDAVSSTDAHRASRGCAHAFCGGCLSRYVGGKIQDRIADVRCPEERCAAALDTELCQGILPREVFERWGAALCESMMMGANTTHCPYKDCSATMLVDDDVGDVGVGGVAESECPSCWRLFCARCGVAPWHAGVTCAEYERLGKGDRGKEDLMLVEMAKGRRWKRCPKCQYFVEKSDGCLHITCSRADSSPLLPSAAHRKMAASAGARRRRRNNPCSICMEPMAPSEAHRGGAACDHAFCRACLSGHVRAKLETGAAVVRCPDPSCGGALDPELCRAALPSEVFERWCRVLCESLFLGARRTYCPFPDCSEMMVADDDGGGESVTQCECQVCRRLFCARCHVAPWHAGVTCDEYQRLAVGDRGREDMLLLEMAKGNQWKRCPNCQFVLEKPPNQLVIKSIRGDEEAIGEGLLREDADDAGNRTDVARILLIFSTSSSPVPLPLPSAAHRKMAASAGARRRRHNPCSICMEPMAPAEAHRGGAACEHAFCRACLSGHVRAKLESGGGGGGGATVRCPDASCAGTLDPELCRGALPSEVFERWCRALCESLFLGARRTYCPFPDCSEMMVADDDGGGDCVTQSECQGCRRLFCARCEVPWRAGVSCAEFARLGEGERAREDLLLVEAAREGNWKRCPRCRFYVEKSSAWTCSVRATYLADTIHVHEAIAPRESVVELFRHVTHKILAPIVMHERSPNSKRTRLHLPCRDLPQMLRESSSRCFLPWRRRGSCMILAVLAQRSMNIYTSARDSWYSGTGSATLVQSTVAASKIQASHMTKGQAGLVQAGFGRRGKANVGAVQRARRAAAAPGLQFVFLRWPHGPEPTATEARAYRVENGIMACGLVPASCLQLQLAVFLTRDCTSAPPQDRSAYARRPLAPARTYKQAKPVDRSPHTPWPTPVPQSGHIHGRAASPASPPSSPRIGFPLPPLRAALQSAALPIRHCAMSLLMRPRCFYYPILLLLLVAAAAADAGGRGAERTYIVRVDDDAKPSVYPTHAHWYEAAVMSASAASDDGGAGWPEGGPLIHTYSAAFHGFSARMTPSAAAALASAPGVATVLPERVRRLATTRSPRFLGLLSSPPSALLADSDFGADLVIAIVDTGISPSHHSFHDRGLGPVPSRWRGVCASGPSFPPTSCNRKLVGARFFSKGYEATSGRMNESAEVRSPLDTDGHGTHTASIAAGRYVFPASTLGYARGVAAGMAPKARLAAYKVCWVGGCFDSDILAAFDAAVADGVDVVSLSVGGVVVPYYLDAIAIGAFGATEAGIVVSASAGNGGPGGLTVTNVAPWMATVGAGSMDRAFPANVKLGDGQVLDGVSVYGGPALESGKMYELVYAGASAGGGGGASSSASDGYSASMCLDGSLDPSAVRGKIVVCDRGVNSRAAKGDVVHRAGAVGMVLANGAFDGEGLVADCHVLPATAVGAAAGEKLRKYIASSTKQRPATGTIVFEGTHLGVHPAPFVAAFSARGPNPQSPEILKPDLIAPGLNILAAWPSGVGPAGIPSDTRRTEFNILSGTSMACPHVSGLAALLKAAHPTWSPAAIKSALMTTAYVRDNSNGTMVDESTGAVAGAFDFGAGHVDPMRAMDPGLVYDIAPGDYVNFLCNLNYTEQNIRAITRSQADCRGARRAGHAGNLNYPSMSTTFVAAAEDDDAGAVRRTMRTHFIRRATNVGGGRAVYRASISAPEGCNVTVQPQQLAFRRDGQRLSFTVRVEATVAPGKRMEPGSSEVRSGALTWSDGRHVVRSPIVVTVQAPLHAQELGELIRAKGTHPRVLESYRSVEGPRVPIRESLELWLRVLYFSGRPSSPLTVVSVMISSCHTTAPC
ncbi:hypothetical protein HU200_006589 [Digitaria exilis]|uniref:RBR-type E3 ubiquitin transferase n=1 Tax=Digitaria exilis TaxID=1010633 RepID=A0A835KRX0_9POAL|nr:hypothetical protein HU200_006589 [Digitaria exilis]